MKTKVIFEKLKMKNKLEKKNKEGISQFRFFLRI